jgi:hypothetical protein
MKLIFKNGPIEVWEVRESYGFDYYVYGLLSDPIVCPSLGMAARLIAAALATA